MRGHALVAWQVLISNWADSKTRPPTLDRYMRERGIVDPATASRQRAPATDADRAEVARIEALIANYRGGPLVKRLEPTLPRIH